jgi:RNA polymerase sigma-70 factor, ECF subfamily
MQDVCTDAEMLALLKGARRGDHAAMDRLYNLYADKVFRYLYARLGQREIAEDLTADVFVRMLQVMPRFEVNSARPVASFSSWLYRIAGNLLRDYYRRQSHRNHADLEDHTDLAMDAPALAQRMAAEEDCQELMGAVSLLNDEQKSVVHYRFGEQMSVQEVADLMGKTEGAIKALQHRALMALRRILVPEMR